MEMKRYEKDKSILKWMAISFFVLAIIFDLVFGESDFVNAKSIFYGSMVGGASAFFAVWLWIRLVYEKIDIKSNGGVKDGRR